MNKNDRKLINKLLKALDLKEEYVEHKALNTAVQNDLETNISEKSHSNESYDKITKSIDIAKQRKLADDIQNIDDFQKFKDNIIQKFQLLLELKKNINSKIKPSLKSTKNEVKTIKSKIKIITADIKDLFSITSDLKADIKDYEKTVKSNAKDIKEIKETLQKIAILQGIISSGDDFEDIKKSAKKTLRASKINNENQFFKNIRF